MVKFALYYPVDIRRRFRVHATRFVYREREIWKRFLRDHLFSTYAKFSHFDENSFSKAFFNEKVLHFLSFFSLLGTTVLVLWLGLNSKCLLHAWFWSLEDWNL